MTNLNETTTVSFRITEAVKQIVELTSKKKGLSKSDFLTMQSIDSMMNFEKMRTMSVLSDFLDVSLSLPYLITQGMSKEEAEKSIQIMTKLQANYVKNRLQPYMRYQRHLTDIAIRWYLQDYSEENTDDKDTFIINQCLQGIYDTLALHDLYPREKWEEKNQAYTLYMEEQKILQQE
jgi:hypothetical protein